MSHTETGVVVANGTGSSRRVLVAVVLRGSSALARLGRFLTHRLGCFTGGSSFRFVLLVLRRNWFDTTDYLIVRNKVDLLWMWLSTV